jgi:hypothetical protein
VFEEPVTYTVVSANGKNTRSYIVSVRGLTSILYVNCNASGYGDGSSWKNAFTSLKAACEAAAEFPEIMLKEIWIAAGTYTPGRTPEDFLLLTANTSYIGGFAGWETDKSQRNVAANTVTISGDLGGGVKAENLFETPYTVETIEFSWGSYPSKTYTPINGDLSFENLRLENALRYGIYTASMTSGSFTLTESRFTSCGVTCSASGSGSVTIQVTDTEIRGGTRGMNMFSDSGRVLIDRVTITGVSYDGISVSSNNTILINNSTIINCGGGGVYMYGSGNKEISGSTISGNTSYNGGGLNVNGGTCTMNGGTISGNVASYSGGGVYVGSNAIFIMRSGSRISGNSAVNTGNCWGGGVSVMGTFRMEGGDIYGNSCTGYGGGVVAASEEGLSTFIMSGGSIYGNTSSLMGGGVYAYNCKTFYKIGGTIYGSDGGSNANRSGNNYGHAAYKDNSNYKNNTLGPSDNLLW